MTDFRKNAELIYRAYEMGDLDIGDIDSIKEFMSLSQDEKQAKYGGHYADEYMYDNVQEDEDDEW